MGNAAVLEVIGKAYCSQCDADVTALLDDVSYSDQVIAIGDECGHELTVDLSAYEPVDEAAERFDIERKESDV